jgi:uncharacterized protein YbbK (DUF523 family)
MAHECLCHQWRNRKVTVENEPRLKLGVPAPKREAELAHVTTDAALGRPRVLKGLDVEEKADRGAQTAVLVAVIIATVSAPGSRSSIGSSTATHSVASRR